MHHVLQLGRRRPYRMKALLFHYASLHPVIASHRQQVYAACTRLESNATGEYDSIQPGAEDNLDCAFEKALPASSSCKTGHQTLCLASLETCQQ